MLYVAYHSLVTCEAVCCSALRLAGRGKLLGALTLLSQGAATASIADAELEACVYTP
jgi:hypothetical protein